MKYIASFVLLCLFSFSFTSAANQHAALGNKKGELSSSGSNLGQQQKNLNGTGASGTGAINKSLQQYQKVQDLKKAIEQILPIAQKAGYPVSSLKKYLQQLSSYKSYDLQKLTLSIKHEIAKIRSFLAKQKSVEKKK